MQSFQTAAEKAFDIISKKILDGELKPGSKLSRRKMAELSGVSVIPVIEALNRLEEEGLVESKPQWGSFVTVPTVEKIKDIYVMREAVECQAARVLARQITAERAQELSRIAVELDSIVYSEQSSSAINLLHHEFHVKLAEYTECTSLITALRRINLFWLLCKAVSTRREKSPVPPNWHLSLVEAIMTGDEDAAEKMMRTHVYDSLNAILGKARESG